ncbi:hypothetical protein [Deinococcus soli (ex Cha et al. 2016)]|uniref:Uncharacterized protein n=1 Tax=Deinococcus soli (ex Cha et al. 2016) TaxID=1309411 RepID=A0ACC6KLY4_9DEIO|nr:hypothetical protein [Deinococcus soli (ex Cha et al. 2016)]MDR6753430.1 hypothetical protein [Deinococcus soli (ex Cha et al. 2016)]
MLKIGHALLMGALHAAYDTTTGPLPPMHEGGQADQYLTDMAIDDSANAEDFLTPKIFPRLDVARSSGEFDVWDRGSLLRPEFRDHAYGDIPNQAHVKKGKGTYRVTHRSLERPIDPEDMASVRNPMQIEEDAALYLAGQARLDMDLRTVEHAMREDAGWTFQYRGVGANPSHTEDTPEFLQFDQPGADVAQFIRGRVRRFKKATNRKPNVLVLGSDVAAALAFNEDIVDRVKYVMKGVADLDLLAGFFDVPTVLDATGVYNKAMEGQADDTQYIVDPKSMLLTYAAPRPSRLNPSGGYTFVWNNLYTKFDGEQEQVEGGLALIRRGRDSRSGVRWIQCHHAVDTVITAPDLGMFFKDVVAASATDW